MSAVIEFTPGQRLDKAVAEHFPQYSRAYLSRLIDGDVVLVNGKPNKSGWKLREGDVITVTVDLSQEQQIEDIELPILFEDDNVVVINKPTGVISHSRGKYWYEPSVASFLRQKTGTDADNQRAGIVHRLDRATSGVMICAKNEETLGYLQKQFGNRTVTKTYIAVIVGALVEPAAIIDMPIERNPKKPSTFRVGSNGKASQTAYRTLKANTKYSLLELTPKTGRTHQLRVHLKQLNHPIVGDPLYDGESNDRLMLHAASLTIKLPGDIETTFTSPLPTEFEELLKDAK
jgi:23S rRNA pseudouridine1911/1915/1917 synthase